MAKFLCRRQLDLKPKSTGQGCKDQPCRGLLNLRPENHLLQTSCDACGPQQLEALQLSHSDVSGCRCYSASQPCSCALLHTAFRNCSYHAVRELLRCWPKAGLPTVVTWQQGPQKRMVHNTIKPEASAVACHRMAGGLSARAPYHARSSSRLGVSRYLMLSPQRLHGCSLGTFWQLGSR